MAKTKNTTYSNCKLLIQNGRYEYDDMCNKLDLFLLMDRITEDQYVELMGMLNERENVSSDDTEDTQPSDNTENSTTESTITE